MKEINSIKQLQPEKNRLRQHQAELENKIRGNWLELKQNLKPFNLVKNAFTWVIQNKRRENLYGGGILKNTFLYGASLLAWRIADKAAKKLGHIFRNR